MSNPRKLFFMMKTFIVFVTLTCSGVFAFAQDNNIYVKGGVNLANISTTNDGRIDDANMLTSFHIGVMGDVPLGKVLTLQPALYFTGKGSKTQNGNPSDASYFKATSNPYYVELPVNLVAKIALPGEGSNFFIGAGPYVAMGVAGKNKVEGKIFGIGFSNKENIDFSNDDPTTFEEQEGAGLGSLRRFDYGVNATAGVQLNNVLFSLNYGYGLAKINAVGDDEDDKNKHRVLSFSFGFRL